MLSLVYIDWITTPMLAVSPPSTSLLEGLHTQHTHCSSTRTALCLRTAVGLQFNQAVHVNSCSHTGMCIDIDALATDKARMEGI